MLTVEDPAFWDGVEPVRFGVLPRLQDSVTVIGYAPILNQTMRLLKQVAVTAWPLSKAKQQIVLNSTTPSAYLLPYKYAFCNSLHAVVQ